MCLPGVPARLCASITDVTVSRPQPPSLRLSQDPAADALLSRDPLALLLGMMLDQQIPMEKAFRGPEVLRDRLGHDLDAHELAERPDLAELFAVPPAVHRFPGSMARRTAELARYLVEHYGGDAAAVWSDARTGQDLLRRLAALPGFGDQKARIFVALLGKQVGVRPEGWREAAGAYGEDGVTRSVADVTGPETLLQVRATKQAAKQAAKGEAGRVGAGRVGAGQAVEGATRRGGRRSTPRAGRPGGTGVAEA